jgi:AraC-like DNA-binding protein
VADFPGPLSLKSVLAGSALWETARGRFQVDAGHCLILNEGRRYSITIESREEVETFCVFFRPGFVGEVRRARVAPDERLLMDPAPVPGPDPGFPETLLRRDRRLSAELERVRAALASGGPSDFWLEERMLALASWMLQAESGTLRAARRLPALRPATRGENLRRLLRARGFMESSLGESLTLERIARESCLSPYHFHRLFVRLFRETPHAYVRRRRLERALGLLIRGRLPVTEICLEAGFRSPGSFSNLFRSRYGLSPLQFRRASRKNGKNR